MTCCHICERPCAYEVEPAFGIFPPETEPDVWTVAKRNGIHIDACHACWMKWPDGHKLFPSRGFERWELTIDELVQLLRETA